MLLFNKYIYTHSRFLFFLHHTHTHTHTHTDTNKLNQKLYMRPHLPRFYHKKVVQHLFCNSMIHDLINTTYKLPEDDVLTPKYPCRGNLI